MSYVSLQSLQVEELLPQVDASLHNHYPTADDAQARQSWIDFRTDAMFTQPMYLWAEHMQSVSSPSYLYWWDWQPQIEGSRQFGAFHAAEVAYVFGDLSMFDIDETPQEEAFSDLMMNLWTQFAKVGNPSVSGVLELPAYTREGHETAVLGKSVGLTDGVRLPQVQLITQAYDRQRQ